MERGRGRPRGSQTKSAPEAQVSTDALRIAELERLLGRKQLELDFFRRAFEHVRGAAANRISDGGKECIVPSKPAADHARTRRFVITRTIAGVSAERFMRTLKQEEVYGKNYQYLEQARSKIGEFLEQVYNRQRLHSALRYLTPEEFEQAC